MLRVVTPSEMRQLDEALIRQHGFSTLVLMENAARAVFDYIRANSTKATPFLIFAGPGNNGGDALALARMLSMHRFDSIGIVIVGDKARRSKATQFQLDQLRSLLPKSSFLKLENVPKPFCSAIIIDGLMGTGARLPLSGSMKRAAELISKFSLTARLICLDVPTGLDAESGELDDVIADVSPEKIITFGAPKIGFYRGDGAKFFRNVSVGGLGAPMPYEVLKGESTYLIEPEDIRERFPERKEGGTKFDYGRLFAIAGSRGMTGAAILASKAALRIGAGVVNTAVPRSERSLVAQAIPELMTLASAETKQGQPSIEGWSELKAHAQKADVIMLGPGILAQPEPTLLMLKALELKKPMVLDAGAIGALEGQPELLLARTSPTILTPHSGEFARLAGLERRDVEANRMELGRSFAKKYSVIMVMKGGPTYTCLPDGTVYINPTGNAGLSTAGSGDVLAGMIAGILAQKCKPTDAAILGVYLHGLAADIAVKTTTRIAMIASDVIDHIPAALLSVGLV